jgi:hypothetical protein
MEISFDFSIYRNKLKIYKARRGGRERTQIEHFSSKKGYFNQNIILHYTKSPF